MEICNGTRFSNLSRISWPPKLDMKFSNGYKAITTERFKFKFISARHLIDIWLNFKFLKKQTPKFRSMSYDVMMMSWSVEKCFKNVKSLGQFFWPEFGVWVENKSRNAERQSFELSETPVSTHKVLSLIAVIGYWSHANQPMTALEMDQWQRLNWTNDCARSSNDRPIAQQGPAPMGTKNGSHVVWRFNHEVLQNWARWRHHFF